LDRLVRLKNSRRTEVWQGLLRIDPTYLGALRGVNEPQ